MAFTQVTSSFDDLSNVYDPMTSLIESLEDYDLSTLASILSQVVEGMETQTMTDGSKVDVLWAIANYLTNLDQSTATNEEG